MARCHAAAVLGYVPAEPHFTPSGTYVDLYAIHPITGVLKRKRYRCDRIRGATARRAYARDLAARLNVRLRGGWNPWAKQEGARSMVSIREACHDYLAARLPQVSHGVSYESGVRIFLAWAGKEGLADAPVADFSRRHAHLFLDQRKVSARTWNNNLRHAMMLWGWLLERDYVGRNPFAGISRRRTAQKLRTIITPAERAACIEWFRRQDPPMVLVCMWLFHTLLRPADLARLRVGDVDLGRQLLTLQGPQTKGRRIRHATIPDVMLQDLLAARLELAPPGYLVLGKGLVPGMVPPGSNALRQRWTKMRKALGWGVDKQLYSLRDSGIVQLVADGVDLHHIMQQADHASIETTQYYLRHYYPEGVPAIRKRASPIGLHDPTDLAGDGAVEVAELVEVEARSGVEP